MHSFQKKNILPDFAVTCDNNINDTIMLLQTFLNLGRGLHYSI